MKKKAAFDLHRHLKEPIRSQIQEIEKKIGPISPQDGPLYDAVARAFLSACTELLQKGFEQEVNRHVRGFVSARKQRTGTPFTSVTIERREKDLVYTLTLEGKWWCSLIYWATCEQKGKEEALKLIPELMLFDSRFFLGQPWVQEQISCWYERGDEKKVHHLFFGTAGKGHGKTFATKKEQYERDLRIVTEVNRLMGDGLSLNQATGQVAANMGTLGIRPLVGVKAVRAIYTKYTTKDTNEPYSPLNSLFYICEAATEIID